MQTVTPTRQSLPALRSALRDDVLRWLVVGAVLAALALCGLVAVLYARDGNSLGETTRNTLLMPVDLVIGPAGVDSWWPMLKAYEHDSEDPSRNLYGLFSEGVKFQYPPSALLMFDLLPASMVHTPGTVSQPHKINAQLLRWLTLLSQAAMIVTLLASAQIVVLGHQRLNAGAPPSLSRQAVIWGLSILLGLYFYPIAFGHYLGQVQVFLNAGVALAILLYMLDRRAAAGVLLAMCALFKPQFGVLLIWSLWRKEYRFTAGFATTLGLGTLAAVARFGIDDHFHYLSVLSFISKHGECYYINQCVNGLLNRFFENGYPLGDPNSAHQSSFAPYHPFVHVATTITSVIILVLAFEPWRPRRASAGAIDLAIILTAATMASPVAWNHHYGLLLPVFALMLPALIKSQPLGWATGPLFAICYLANVIRSPGFPWLYANPWTSLAASHLFFGVVLLFCLQLRLRAVQMKSTPAFASPLAASWKLLGQQ